MSLLCNTTDLYLKFNYLWKRQVKKKVFKFFKGWAKHIKTLCKHLVMGLLIKINSTARVHDL